MKTRIVPVILCGGSGSRLWPLSREQHPKPLIRIDHSSLLQKALLRSANIPNVTDIITITNRELLFQIKDQYQEVAHRFKDSITHHFILEPFARNTAPAIATAALQVAQQYGENTLMLILAADHLITNQHAFEQAIQQAYPLAQAGKLVTFGITPTHAETGYGYIEHQGTQVKRFIEKPDFKNAQNYIQSGNFLWNSGIFCFTAGALIAEMQQHSCELLQATRTCFEQSDTATAEGFTQRELHAQTFQSIPENSIDYAVMENTQNAAVVACDIGWSDVGCWNTLGDLQMPDAQGNRLHDNTLAIDSNNCTVNSTERLIGIIGLKNTVIVDTPDALLVADKSCAQTVKLMYAQLKSQNHDSHKVHRTVQRPWGSYTVLEDSQHFKIKRIQVRPHAQLSLQMHHHRSEHWVIVQGSALAVKGEQVIPLNKNESIDIPVGCKHRLTNIGTETLIVIEVQTGTYLGEDDIVRFEDAYGRVAL